MKIFFQFLTILSVVFLSILILLQSRGTGLSATFGGEGNTFRSKRGAEKVIYNATIVFAVVFVLSVILGLLSKS
jgi:preprotein translocase subunit SecG